MSESRRRGGTTETYGEDLAYVHSRGFGGLARAASDAVVEELRRSGIQSGHIVDVGCGSGEAALRFTRSGFVVLGIDASPHMLALATATAPEATFARSDPGPVWPDRVVAVTGFGEAITYVDSGGASAIETTLAEAAMRLDPRGVLVFDVIETGPPMRYTAWQAGDDWAVRHDVTEDGDARLVRRDILVFRRAPESPPDAGRVSSERHAVRVFDRKELAKLLARHGFDAEFRPVYGSFKLLNRRIAVVATRR